MTVFLQSYYYTLALHKYLKVREPHRSHIPTVLDQNLLCALFFLDRNVTKGNGMNYSSHRNKQLYMKLA